MNPEKQVTVDLVMELVDEAADYHYGQYERDAIKSALAALVESRDQAERALDWCKQSLAQNDAMDLIAHLKSENAALKSQVGELREAVQQHWWYCTDDGEAGCRHCGNTVEIPEEYDMTTPPKIEHPDCIVSRLEDAK